LNIYATGSSRGYRETRIDDIHWPSGTLHITRSFLITELDIK